MKWIKYLIVVRKEMKQLQVGGKKKMENENML